MSACREENVPTHGWQETGKTQWRDALLPKLISGELRIKDAGKFVEKDEDDP